MLSLAFLSCFTYSGSQHFISSWSIACPHSYLVTFHSLSPLKLPLLCTFIDKDLAVQQQPHPSPTIVSCQLFDPHPPPDYPYTYTCTFGILWHLLSSNFMHAANSSILPTPLLTAYKMVHNHGAVSTVACLKPHTTFSCIVHIFKHCEAQLSQISNLLSPPPSSYTKFFMVLVHNRR